MTKYKGFEIFIHEITEEFGEKIAVVNKGSEKSMFCFKVKANLIDGLFLV